MRVWSVLVIPFTMGVLVAACGSGDSSVFPDAGTGLGVPDSTIDQTPATFGDGGVSDGSNPATCVPKTCGQLGYTCGPNADGCGGMLACGSCASPAFCGGGGYSVCGGNMAAIDGGGSICVPKTCSQQGFTCGPNSDGCGNTLNCGSCAAPGFCGGGGYSICGGNTVAVDSGGNVCVPKTCQQLGYTCGPAGDGCGNPLNCGMCVSPQFCGGGGFNLCGGNASALDGGSVCVPKTCQQLGFNCGPAGDGCGNVIPNCGTCQSPNICGGGGQASVCGDSFADGGQPCTGLCQQQVQCDGGGTTTVTGTVVAPTDSTKGYGNPDPLYNALVYIPNAPVQAFQTGLTCDVCGAQASGSPLVTATTGPDGTFTLTNAPCGQNIPLVIQLGRWRRQITIPAVSCCAPNPLTQVQTRLPRNQGEGDIPLMAIATGDVDPLECVLLKMGIDQTEFTNPTGSGRIQVYVADQSGGSGSKIDVNTPSETNLWATAGSLEKYDQVLLPCEGIKGGPGGANFENGASQQNLIDYTSAGGRVFATHYSYAWLYNASPFSSTAGWNVNQPSPSDPLTATIDTSFQKGQDFAAWLGIVGALSATNPPRIQIASPRHDLDSVVAPSQRFIYSAGPSTVQEFAFNTPVGAGAGPQCGRVIYSDFHVNQLTGNNKIFPAECGAPKALTAQEKVLEFMLFDLSSCIQPQSPPQPMCTPRTCQSQSIGCGPAGDGCGNQLDCGPCTLPQTCGGGGVSSQCGSIDASACTPRSCAQQGISCGPAGDGCGNQLNCGTCVGGLQCGGGGQPGVCGLVDSAACVPETCGRLGFNCGPAGDGCGGLLQCGPCVNGQTCGGAGQPGVCGAVDSGACVPKTCQQLAINCGPAGDGCGGLIQCGTCSAPATCGGGGQSGVCGGGTAK